MTQAENIEKFLQDLPDAESSARFFRQLAEQKPSETNKLLKNKGLLSDILTLVSFSPLLATTLLQNPSYISWLARRRGEAKTRDKEELLESLARFSMTSSQIETPVLLARFRRRELMRIYLRDIRRLGTIAEITEEISHLADAVLEYALRQARQEMNNRYGIPLEADEKGKARAAQFCIVALGKLGSGELNYSSDIDLLFLYSSEGSTSGQGSRGAVTNREYFVKLCEFITKLVGGQSSGEGAAYRVDLRLRPHGRVGALAISVKDAVNYYQTSAQAWERQTLIRSRSAAGEAEVFKKFFTQVEDFVFSKDETIENALRNVRLSKEKINLEKLSARGFNIKLGRGGIREIEFIAQALQIAYGGRDEWLRAPHTLISLARLADRNLLSETELTALADAYDFMRRLEHRLQMEHGLQTHLVPEDAEKRRLVAKRMHCPTPQSFEAELKKHAANVNRIFSRVFEEIVGAENIAADFTTAQNFPDANHYKENPRLMFNENSRAARSNAPPSDLPTPIVSALGKADLSFDLTAEHLAALKKFCEISPYFTEMIAANPKLIESLPAETEDFQSVDYAENLTSNVLKQTNFHDEIGVLRIEWTKNFLRIAAFDAFEKIDLNQSKRLQTELAEASLQAAFEIMKREVRRRFDFSGELNFAVGALGKLGGRGMDYGSDLDLILLYDDAKPLPVENSTPAEFYARAAEIFVTALSGFTREGHLYRVDLRLRPDGKNGATILGKNAFFNYLETRSAIWEWLAYVKLRAVGGDLDSASEIEEKARRIIHQNASDADENELKTETARVRERLEKEKTRRAKNVDIKFGAGGMLDVYFAMRFLQLRDNVRDEDENRSTRAMLRRLYEKNSLRQADFEAFDRGYDFLSCLDHNLRLTVGRTNRLPQANQAARQTIVERMKLDSINDLNEKLHLYRLEIRRAFENVLR
jgi:[glutamine synthetase] adenylyltransferase / [glutamine synthetase]-adenylyl-L-tyrosine phosphorylase